MTTVNHGDGLAVLTAVRDCYGFLNSTQLRILATDPTTRLTPVLVRCGSGRFTAPAQDAQHFVDIIELAGQHGGTEYVRDVAVLDPSR